MYTISIIGVGNIGFRHLQAALKLQCIKKIILIELCISNLQPRINSIENINDIEIITSSKIDKSVINSDLIIVSTNSNQRFGIVEKLINKNYKGKLLLEKFLFPNEKIFRRASEMLLSYKNSVYVNQWMRKTSFKNLVERGISGVEVNGSNWGILCNGVHFIDLICELLNINNLILNLEKSFCSRLIESKRKGYKEFKGVLHFQTPDDKFYLRFVDIDTMFQPGLLIINVEKNTNIKSYIYDHPKLYTKDDESYIPHLSVHATESIEQILQGVNPNLPDIRSSLYHHLFIFDSLRTLLNEEEYKNIAIT